MYKAFHMTDDIDSMFQEKKEKEISPALVIALIQQFKDLRNTIERANKD